MIRHLSMLLTMLVSLLSAWDYVHAAGRSNSTFVVTRSVAATLADPSKEIAEIGQLTLLSPGTKALVYQNIKNDYGILALSEFGVWVWIDESSFWTRLDPIHFGFQKYAVTITRPNITVPIGGGRIDLGVSTTYELVNEGELYYGIKIRGKDTDYLDPRKEWIVVVPRENAAIIKPHTMSVRSVDYFEKGVVGNIWAITKGCDDEHVVTTTLGAESNLGIIWSAIKLGLSAERQQRTVSSYARDVYVKRTYYTRSISKGEYIITAKQNCVGDVRGVSYTVETPSSDFPVHIDGSFVDRYSLNALRNNRPIVTCYNDFDRYLAALVDQGLQQDEAIFVLSKTARWKEYRNKKLRVCDVQE